MRVTDVAPDPSLVGVPTNATIPVDFDADMNGDTVLPNIKIRKKGARKVFPGRGVLTFIPDTCAASPVPRIDAY